MVRRLFACLGMFLLVAGSSAQAEILSDSATVGSPRSLIDSYFSRPGVVEADREISVAYDDRTLREVCRDLTRKLGINFVPARGLENERINLTLNSVRWRRVIEYLAAKYELEMETWDENMIVFNRPPQVSMEFSNAPIRVVLDLLARQVSKNIVLHQDVQGTVTLNLQKVRWDRALETIAKTAGYAVVPELEDNSLIRVIPRSMLEEEIVLEFIQLKYIRPPSTYRAVMPQSLSGEANAALSSGFFVGTPRPSQGIPDQEFTLLQALAGILERQEVQGESVFYDAFSNSLLVSATKPKLIEIKNLIRALDKEPEQVFVEVTFISTTNRDFLELGLRFDDAPTDGVERGLDGRFTFQNSTGNSGLLQTWNTGNQQRDDRARFLGQFPFLIGEDTDIFQKQFMIPGVLDITQTALLMRFAQFDDNSRITQRPTLMTLSNHEATIFVGEQVPYVRQTANTDANGNLAVTLAEGPGSPISVGFTLHLTPHVVPGTNDVIMSVIPRVNTLTGTTSPILGLERFGQGESFIDLPRTEDQIVVTKLLVESGRTAVIGGLMQERLQEQLSRVPILSSIPIIGPLFTWKNHVSSLENLLIFITPTVLRDSEASERLFEQHYKRFQESDFFFGKYKSSPGDLWIHNLEGGDWVDVEPDEAD